MGEWKKNPWVAVSAFLALALAIVLTTGNPFPKRNIFNLECLQCGKDFQASIVRNTIFPINCVYCHKVAAYPVVKYKCQKCGNIFSKVIKDMLLVSEKYVSTPKDIETVKLVCPKCGATEIEIVK